MNARQKLNQAAVTGALLFGGLLWLATGSWVIFIFVVVIILGLAYYDNSIRLEPSGQTRKDHPWEPRVRHRSKERK